MRVKAKLLCLLFFALPTPLWAASKSDFDAAAFAAAVAKAEAGDPGVDYTWLRRQDSARTSYAGNNWQDLKKADGLIDTNPDVALRMAQVRLSGVWTDFMAHIVAQLAYAKLGQSALAQRQADIVKAILHSVSDGHKGTSAINCFNAVSAAEEMRVVVLLRWKEELQALVMKDGHNFDVLTVTDSRDGSKREAWFNIDAFFGKELGL